MLIGSHFLHPDRNLHGNPTFSVELLYLNDAPAGFGVAAARQRVQMCLDKGAMVALRVDWANRQALPPTGDNNSVSEYVEACQQIAADETFRRCSWLICGNEPNLADENRSMGRPMEAYWPARVVFGHGTPTDSTDNVYQYVRTVHPTMQVLLPAVAPYSPEMGGDANMPTPIDGRSAWAPWESYQYAMWLHAYGNDWHADIGEVKGAMHTYGMPGIASVGPGEPFTDQREPSYGAQFGSRWLQDGLSLAVEAQWSVYGSAWHPWVLVTEANVYRPPQTPRADYPAGWWLQLAKYVGSLPNIMGLAAFVDQDYGNNWGDTAMTIPMGRLPQWDADHNSMLEVGTWRS